MSRPGGPPSAVDGFSGVDAGSGDRAGDAEAGLLRLQLTVWEQQL